jgi:hypothetical protein
LPQLTDYSTLSFGDHYTIIVNLAFYSVDLVTLELNPHLGYTNIDTYFAITGVEDLAGNPAVQVRAASRPYLIPI